MSDPHTIATVHVAQQAAPYLVALSDDAGHHWQADEPLALGGGDTATTPDRMLLGALGACTAITLRMYATRKGWPLQDVRVDLRLNPAGKPASGADIERTLHLIGPLDDAQRARLLEIANACPVHKILSGEVRIATQTAQP